MAVFDLITIPVLALKSINTPATLEIRDILELLGAEVIFF